MKLEQYILKILNEQLLTEQYQSGYFIKIFSEYSQRGKEAKQKAEEAGFVFGFAVKAVRYRGKNIVSDESKIVDDIITVITSQPKDEEGDILNIGRKFDNPKYSYIFIEQPSIRKRVKNYIGLVQDRSLFDEIFNTMSNAIDKKNSTVTYYEKQQDQSEFDKLRKVGSIRIYNESEYTKLLQDIDTYVRVLDDTQLTSYWNQHIQPNLSKIDSFKQISIADTPNTDIKDTSTSTAQKDVNFKGFFGDAKVLINPVGEKVIIPVHGLQGMGQESYRDVLGIFYGEFSENGLPKKGEIYYGTNAYGKTWEDAEWDLTDKQKEWGLKRYNTKKLKPSYFLSLKDLRITYVRGTTQASGRKSAAGEPGFHFDRAGASDMEHHYLFNAVSSRYIHTGLTKENISRAYPDSKNITGFVYKGSFKTGGGYFNDGTFYICMNGTTLIPIREFKNGEATKTTEIKTIQDKISTMITTIKNEKKDQEEKEKKQEKEKKDQEKKDQEKKDQENRKKKKKAIEDKNKNSIFTLYNGNIRKTITLFQLVDGVMKSIELKPKLVDLKSPVVKKKYNNDFYLLGFTYKSTAYEFYVKADVLKDSAKKK